jgi:N-acetylneuraminic acid mutarotase
MKTQRNKTTGADRSQAVLPVIGTILLLGLGLLLWSNHKRQPTAVWVTAWRMQPAFHHPRRALAAAASDTHVYVIGGMDNDNHYVGQVEYAPIRADGRLGEWRFTTPLEEPRFYLAAAVLDGYIYAIGGANGRRGQDNVPSATVERAAIRPDGSLGPWRRVAYLTTPRRGLQAAVYRNHIYAIGGYDGVFLKSVERADVKPDGGLSDWRLDPARAVVDRYIHSAASLGDKLYLLGGHEQNPETISYGDVEMTRITGDGGLQPWEIQKTVLKTPRFIAAAFAMNRFIYMLGGHDGRNRLRSVEKAPLDGQGRVGPWSFTTPLHEERSATALAVHGDNVYVFGGMGVGGALNSVEMATQRDNGQLGYWTSPNKADN